MAETPGHRLLQKVWSRKGTPCSTDSAWTKKNTIRTPRWWSTAEVHILLHSKGEWQTSDVDVLANFILVKQVHYNSNTVLTLPGHIYQLQNKLRATLDSGYTLKLVIRILLAKLCTAASGSGCSQTYCRLLFKCGSLNVANCLFFLPSRNRQCSVTQYIRYIQSK